MITTKHLVRARIRGGKTEKVTHHSQVIITGLRDLARFADILERQGKSEIASLVRRAKRFSMNVTPEQLSEIDKLASR